MVKGRVAKKRRSGKSQKKISAKKAVKKQRLAPAKPATVSSRQVDEPVKELKEAFPGYEQQEHHEKTVKRPGSKVKKYIIISVAAIIICIILFLVFSKLRFVLNDELSIELMPLHQSFSIENNETITARVSITNNNFVRCSTECNFSLKDISTGSVIYSDSKILNHKESLEEEFNIEMPGKGRGQRIYSFESECKNIRTVVCLTDGESRFESATIIANYDLTGEEKKIISEKKTSIEDWFLRVKELRGLYAQFKNMLPVLPDNVDGDKLQGVLASSLPEVVMAVDTSERLADAWDSEDYILTQDYFTQALVDKTITVISLFKDSIQAGVELVDARNSNIELLKQTKDYQDFSAELLDHCTNESSPENDKRLNELSNITYTILGQLKMLTGRTDISENELGKAIAQSLEGLEREKSDFLLAKGRTELLLMKGKELLKQKNPESNLTFGDGCGGLRKLSYEFEKENNASSEPAGSELNASDATEDAEVNSTILLNNSENKAQLAAFCKADNHTSNESLKDANMISSFIKLDFGALEAEKIISFPGPVDIPSQTTLPDNPHMCCSEARCTPCCTANSCSDDEKHYPVIFIHGHAFNDANSPEYSMMAFSKMQRKLSTERFVSFGELDLETDLGGVNGEWGMISQPITVRASYYYITHYDLVSYRVNVQKTESIENYALRLKEIIVLVKQKTGSPKVNIVAHSMGGLVTRQYLELFGYGEVDKVVLINTPNHGVTGKVMNLCSVFGASKECSELAEGSIFLQRLNSKSLPEGAKVYAVRSVGCAMDDNENGDGVVTSDSAYLDGAMNYEIKGICKGSFGTDLHTDSLDPEKYPAMYELVLSILNQ